MNDTHPDDLVTLTTTETEFQAGILVAVLEDAGIRAVSFGAIAAMEPLGRRLAPVLVQVRQADLEKARAAIQQNVADSVDLDWDEVDVGDRLDDLPLAASDGTSIAANIASFIATVVLVAIFAGGVITLLLILF